MPAAASRRALRFVVPSALEALDDGALRAVKQYRDVSRGHSKTRGGVLRRELLEYAHDEHVALHIGQLVHAPEQRDMLFRRHEQRFHAGSVRGDRERGVDRVVRKRAVAATSHIAGGIADEHGHEAAGTLLVQRQLARLRHRQQRREGFLHGVDRLYVGQAFTYGDRSERPSMYTCQCRDPADEIRSHAKRRYHRHECDLMY